MALFGRNATKMEEATLQNGPHEVVVHGKEADLASSSLTLLLTKHALSELAKRGVEAPHFPLWESH
jgi:hypothetical protein